MVQQLCSELDVRTNRSVVAQHLRQWATLLNDPWQETGPHLEGNRAVEIALCILVKVPGWSELVKNVRLQAKTSFEALWIYSTASVL